jgi:hypothetical protein
MSPKMTQIRITCYENPRHTVSDTAWGNITYGQWCQREADRLTAAGRKAVVRANNHGRVAIFVG